MEAQLVTSPQAAPGKCFYCGISVDRKWWLDTGIQMEFYGAIYICDQCFTWLGSLAGLISPEQADELRLNVARLELENETLNERNRALTSAINSMEVVHVDRSSISSDPHLLHPSTAGVLEVVKDDPESTGEGTRGLDDGEEGSSEPSDEQGMANVRSITGDNTGESESEFAGFEV